MSEEKVWVESSERTKSPHTPQPTLPHKRVTWDFKFDVVDKADAVIVAVETDAADKANKTNKAKAMTDVAANKAHEADEADAAKVDKANEADELNKLDEANEAGIANAKADEADAKADEAYEAHVSDMPGEADVVADTVNVFEAIKAEAVDVADDTEDKAEATDAD